ncbi:PQQ-binding-like beta-propeller repeat protein [Microbulbifer pacificus]|uniref:outer membrane protein assembly factor BamB family protein n=1 Tax=Microbulbifer pacificus TaxID=407164 RepID=UPI001319BABC|nr:PQQ-binding-like beta-propeller repeat protein [Microbulbifer pacificus]
MYFSAFNGNYYRFSPEGALVWSSPNVGVAMNQAAVSDGRVFVGTVHEEGGSVLALDNSGAIRWRVTTESGVIASPVLSADASTVYVATYGGVLLALRAEDGEQRWRMPLPEGERVSAAPVLSADEGSLYVHTNSHQVFAFQTPHTSQVVLQSAGGAQSQSPSILWQRSIGSANSTYF